MFSRREKVSFGQKTRTCVFSDPEGTIPHHCLRLSRRQIVRIVSCSYCSVYLTYDEIGTYEPAAFERVIMLYRCWSEFRRGTLSPRAHHELADFGYLKVLGTVRAWVPLRLVESPVRTADPGPRHDKEHVATVDVHIEQITEEPLNIQFLCQLFPSLSEQSGEHGFSLSLAPDETELACARAKFLLSQHDAHVSVDQSSAAGITPTGRFVVVFVDGDHEHGLDIRVTHRSSHLGTHGRTQLVHP